jgi:hypothetical protein
LIILSGMTLKLKVLFNVWRAQSKQFILLVKSSISPTNIIINSIIQVRPTFAPYVANLTVCLKLYFTGHHF